MMLSLCYAAIILMLIYAYVCCADAPLLLDFDTPIYAMRRSPPCRCLFFMLMLPLFRCCFSYAIISPLPPRFADAITLLDTLRFFCCRLRLPLPCHDCSFSQNITPLAARYIYFIYIFHLMPLLLLWLAVSLLLALMPQLAISILRRYAPALSFRFDFATPC